MSDLAQVYELRTRREADTAFIMATFLRGLYYGNEHYKLIPKQVFMDNYKRVVEMILENSTVVVACLREDPDVILGYSILAANGAVAHWCFVKAAWRGRGIGRSLVPASLMAITHFTHNKTETAADGLSRWLKKFPNCIFNPFEL